MRILIIEDEADLAAAIADYLELHHCQCDFAFNGRSGLNMATRMTFDMIILDLMLPKINGISLCEQLRQLGKVTPVLMLTASDTSEDQLAGFQAGIDDYVTKPCTMPLLWARLQAIYRRTTPQTDILTVDQLCLYLSQQRATRNDQPLNLTPTGWQLLECLAQHSPNVVKRSELEQAAWPNGEVSDSNFNVQLHQLRKAVDKPFDYPLIHTRVGVGLQLGKQNTQ